MTTCFDVTRFSGVQPQFLRNVVIISAAIIRVQTGRKRLLWKDKYIDIDNKSLLLCHSRQQLTFENVPIGAQFQSLVFSFFVSPLPEQLELSRTNHKPNIVIPLSPALAYSLDFLQKMPRDQYSDSAQRLHLQALYQCLAEQGVLHVLFPQKHLNLSQKICDLLAQAPCGAYTLENMCQHFNMSRATLIRRLKAENTCFRQLLTDIRMGYALNLMQSGERNLLQLALGCGYQSQHRFTQRFHQRFGISPKRYIASLPDNDRASPDRQ